MNINGALDHFPPLSAGRQLLATTLALVAMTTCCHRAISQDFAIVTCERAYVVDEEDAIVQQLTTFSTVDIIDPGEPWLLVKTDTGKQGWIRRELVHMSTEFDDITEDNSAAIREILEIARNAEVLRSEGEYDRSVAQMKSALKKIENTFGTDNTGYAWLLAYLVPQQLDAEDTVGASATLKQAEKIFRDLGELQSLHAADLFNVKAILAGYKVIRTQPSPIISRHC